jgi:glycosyltransferase involved in cell wall biosynthesis
LDREVLRSINRLKPKILIYLPTQSATFWSLLRARILRIISRARVILISMQPYKLSKFEEWLVRIIKPELLLTPSPALLTYAKDLGLNASFLPLGVNLDRFTPVDEEKKKRLREKYHLPLNVPLVLHVGHIQPLRNLEWLVKLKQSINNIEVLIVGSSSMGVNQYVHKQILNASIKVIQTYIESIEEIYQLADVYVFPVKDEKAAIGVPLSVLEAMACNLPVVSTPFGGLPFMFTEKNGFFYAADIEKFIYKVKNALKLSSLDVQTRKLVSPYTWESVAETIIKKSRVYVHR